MPLLSNKLTAKLIKGVFFILLIFSCYAKANVRVGVGEQGVVTNIPSNISEMFPAATRIAQPLANHRVTPVYQLNQLLGYVFESDDFTEIIGFSGQTINLLIAIDPQGTLIKIKVLNHHEPIFLHGLGEQPMFSFIKQFEGHSIKERFIVDARDRRRQDITHIDGVTKATVSALVINDTIITSALTVARSLLDGYAPLSDQVINQDFFSEMNFEQLVAAGYISNWVVKQAGVAAQFPYLSSVLAELEPTENLIDLYLAVISVPIVGKNLLGEREYARLLDNIAPGGIAFLVLDNGALPFVSPNFVSQTAPERFKIVQAGLPQDSRDIDFYSFIEPNFTVDLPSHQRLLVLNIKNQSGFDLASPFEYSLTLDYNVSFLARSSHQFSASVQLPAQLFVKNRASNQSNSLPLWQRIWSDRIVEIMLLLGYLVVILVLFIGPNHSSRLLVNQQVVSQHVVNKQVKPNYVRAVALAFTVIFIGFYAQGQLSVVNIYTLLLSLSQGLLLNGFELDGFVLDVFLLDPILFILWSVVFISLFIWGRGLFCGWLCPFGAMQELVTLLATKLSIKQWQIAPATHRRARWLKYALLVGLIGCAFYSLSLAEQLAELEPFKTAVTMNFNRYWPFTVYALVLLALSLKIHKFYCRYLCPLGAGLAVLGALPLVKWIKRRPECGSPCQLCRNKKCAINAIEPNGAINYGECVGCFDCVITVNQPKLCVIDKYSKNRRVAVKTIP